MEISFINVNFLKKENLCPDFRAFPVSVGSQCPLAPNDSYATEAYFGVA